MPASIISVLLHKCTAWDGARVCPTIINGRTRVNGALDFLRKQFTNDAVAHSHAHTDQPIRIVRVRPQPPGQLKYYTACA